MTKRLTLSLVLAAVVATGCAAPKPAISLLAEGRRAMERRQYDAAVVAFDQYVQRKPGEAQGRYELGRALLSAGHTAEARENLYIAHHLDLNDDPIFFELCEALYQNGDHDELYALLRRRSLDRREVKYYFTLADYARVLGDLDTAEQALITAARIDAGRTAAPQLQLSEFYKAAGDNQRALTRLRMALYLDPTSRDIADRIREFGQIPGPEYALRPAERR